MNSKYDQLVAYSLLSELELGSVQQIKVFYENIRNCFQKLTDEKIQLQSFCGIQSEIEKEISKQFNSEFSMSSSEIIGISQIILVFNSSTLIICLIIPDEAIKLDNQIQNGIITLMQVFQDLNVNLNLCLNINQKCSDYLIQNYSDQNKNQVDLFKVDSQIQNQHNDWKLVQSQNLSQYFLMYRIDQFEQKLVENLNQNLTLIFYEIFKSQLFKQQFRLKETIQSQSCLEINQYEEEFKLIIENLINENLINEINQKIINRIQDEINQFKQKNESYKSYDFEFFINQLQVEDCRFYLQNGESDQGDDSDEEIKENMIKICDILNVLSDELAQQYIQQIIDNIIKKHRKIECIQTCFKLQTQENQASSFVKDHVEIMIGSEIIQLSEITEIIYYYKFQNKDNNCLFILKEGIEYKIIAITQNTIKILSQFKNSQNLFFWFIENSDSQQKNSALYCFNFDNNISVKQMTFDSLLNIEEKIIKIFDNNFDSIICKVHFNCRNNEFYLLDLNDNCFIWDLKQQATSFISQKQEQVDKIENKQLIIFKENNHLKIYDDKFNFQSEMMLSNHNQIILNGNQNFYYFQNIDLLLKGQSSTCMLISKEKFEDILLNKELLFFTEQAFKSYGNNSKLSQLLTKKQSVCIKLQFKQQLSRSKSALLSNLDQTYELDFLDQINFPKSFYLNSQQLQYLKEIFYSRIPQSLQISENALIFESIFNESNLNQLQQYLEAQKEIIKDNSFKIIGISGTDQNNLNNIFSLITQSRSLKNNNFDLIQFQILKHIQNYYLIISLKAELSTEAHEKQKLLFYLSICDQIIIVDNSKIENQLKGLMTNLAQMLKAYNYLKLQKKNISFVTFSKSHDQSKYNLNEKKQELLKDQTNKDVKDAFDLIRFSQPFNIELDGSLLNQQLLHLNESIFSSIPQEQSNLTLSKFIDTLKSINNNRFINNKQILQILQLFAEKENELQQLQDRLKQLKIKQLNWKDRENRLLEAQTIISDLCQILSRVKQQEENLNQLQSATNYCQQIKIEEYDLEQIMAQIQIMQKLSPQQDESQISYNPLEQCQDQLRQIQIKFNKDIDVINLSINEISEEDIRQEIIKQQKELEEQRIKQQKELEEQRIKQQQKELEEQRIKQQKELEEQRIKQQQKELEEQRIKQQKELEEQRIKQQQKELEEQRIKQQKELEEQRIKQQNQLEEQRIKQQKQLEEQRIKQQNQLEEQKKQVQLASLTKDLQHMSKQINKKKLIKSKGIEEQIKLLQIELQDVENDKSISYLKKKYQYAQNSQELMQLLLHTGQAEKISIPMSQIINDQNFEVMLYVLKESLLINQQRELLMLKQQQFGSVDSLIGTFGNDQSCLTFRTNKINYEQMKNDENYRQNVCFDFKKKVSQCLKVEFDDIEILGFRQGSTKIDINIKITEDQRNLLEKVCEGNIYYYKYYKGCKSGLSSSDFDPNYNMRWDNIKEKKEQRGPPDQRYDYYFPKGWQGFGLNVALKKYEKSLDWLEMNGNKNEWRILYHGTKQEAVTPIVKDNFKVITIKDNGRQAHCNSKCFDIEDQKDTTVGDGIYFSDDIDTALGYSEPVKIYNKIFSVIFMSRVNPKKIRQSEEMKKLRYFVVNESKDVRPYRILLKELKEVSQQNNLQNLKLNF